MPGLHHEFVKTRLCCSLLRAFFKCWQLTLVRGEPLGHCLGHPVAQLVWERACRGCSPLSFRHLAVSGSVVVSQRPWADPTEWQFCTRPNEVDHQQSSGLSSHSSQSALVQVHHLHSRQACQVGHLLQLPHADHLLLFWEAWVLQDGRSALQSTSCGQEDRRAQQVVSNLYPLRMSTC